MLHKVWLSRCPLIQTKVSCKVTIEDTKQCKRRDRGDSKCFRSLVIIKMSQTVAMVALEIKSWTFTYYSLTDESEYGDYINDRLLRHQTCIARESPQSEVAEREQLFMKNGVVEHRY